MNSRTKWIILILAGITNAIAVAAPSMSLSVLFDEISQKLDLNLVEVGIIWGISSLPGIFTSLLGGAIVDRFGPKRIVIVGTLLVGVTGALRGLSSDFVSLLITVILAGLLSPLINMSGLKNCSLWFPQKQLGIANGILSMGMALGFLLGSMLSATVLSPWMGGWNYVFYFYGALTVLLAVPWLFTPQPPPAHTDPQAPAASGMVQSIGKIIRLRNTWLLGFGIFGIGGCVQATLGYLPLYLRGQGWSPVTADAALSSFHLVSMIMVLPIALLSDRLGSRKNLVMVMVTMIITGVGLLAFIQGPVIWGAVILAGLVRDGFMAVFMTMILETDGVGKRFAGTATGFVTVFSMLGSMVMPPLGNNLASIEAGIPFLFWAGMAIAGLVCLAMTRRPQHEVSSAAVNITIAE